MAAPVVLVERPLALAEMVVLVVPAVPADSCWGRAVTVAPAGQARQALQVHFRAQPVVPVVPVVLVVPAAPVGCSSVTAATVATVAPAGSVVPATVRVPVVQAV
jgi:hypothetical protein